MAIKSRHSAVSNTTGKKLDWQAEEGGKGERQRARERETERETERESNPAVQHSKTRRAISNGGTCHQSGCDSKRGNR